MNPTKEDIALIARFQNGDKQAFTELYKLYSNTLYLNLVKLVKSEDIATEMLQEIFVIIWEKRHTIEIKSSLRAYLFRVAENKVMDFYRRVNRNKHLLSTIQKIASE